VEVGAHLPYSTGKREPFHNDQASHSYMHVPVWARELFKRDVLEFSRASHSRETKGQGLWVPIGGETTSSPDSFPRFYAREHFSYIKQPTLAKKVASFSWQTSSSELTVTEERPWQRIV